MTSPFRRRKVNRRSPAGPARFEPQRTGDDKVDRQFSEVAQTLEDLDSPLQRSVVLEAKVASGGVNLVLAHPLGRAVQGVIFAGADRWAATDFWYRRSGNPFPERALWLHVDVAAVTNLSFLVF